MSQYPKTKAEEPAAQEIIKSPSQISMPELVQVVVKAQDDDMLDDELRKDFLRIGFEIADNASRSQKKVKVDL